MLGKLFKYELRYTSRMIPFLYLGLFVAALFCRLLRFLGEEVHDLFTVLFTLSIGLFILLCCGTLLAPHIFSVIRFYKNMVGDEGYLTFTLPVKPRDHILAKFLCAILWLILGAAAVVIAIAIVALSPDMIRDLKEGIDELIEMFRAAGLSGQVNALVIQYAAALLLGGAQSILMLFAAMSIGQLVSGHKVIASVGAYIGLNLISETISGVVAVFFILIPELVSSEEIISEAETLVTLNTSMTISLILSVIFSIVFFLLTNLLFTKKLNLD